MINPKLYTPILFLIFNRLDTTKQVFDVIRQVQPQRLYIASDGSRSDRPGEAEKVQSVRDYVLEGINWDCEVKTLFRERNLGCRVAVSSAIDWFFDHEPEGIILEDDCLPDSTFFAYCQDLLEYYRHDEQVMAISGDNFQFGRKRTDYSYYFSRYIHIWGWATWRRAWQHYNVSMKDWPTFRVNKSLKTILKDSRAVAYWTKIFNKTYEGTVETWDYQWLLASWIQNGFSIIPNVNLVANIGFGEGATNTAEKKSKYANMVVQAIELPLKHPPILIQNVAADRYTEQTMFGHNSGITLKVLRKVAQVLNLSIK